MHNYNIATRLQPTKTTVSTTEATLTTTTSAATTTKLTLIKDKTTTKTTETTELNRPDPKPCLLLFTCLFLCARPTFKALLTRVADPARFYPDPNPTFVKKLDMDPSDLKDKKPGSGSYNIFSQLYSPFTFIFRHKVQFYSNLVYKMGQDFLNSRYN